MQSGYRTRPMLPREILQQRYKIVEKAAEVGGSLVTEGQFAALLAPEAAGWDWRSGA